MGASVETENPENQQNENFVSGEAALGSASRRSSAAAISIVFDGGPR
jgi:hypothetical protein